MTRRSPRSKRPKPRPDSLDEWVDQAPQARVTRAELVTILGAVIEAIVYAQREESRVTSEGE